MGKKSLDSSGWQESSLGKHQGTKVHGSCGTSVVPDFVLVAGGACGPWAEPCSGQLADIPFPHQPANGLCRAGPASRFLWETQLPQPSNQCGSHRLKAHGDSGIVIRCSSLWPALSFLSLQTASPWEKCSFVSVLLADPSGCFPRRWGFNVLEGSLKS